MKGHPEDLINSIIMCFEIAEKYMFHPGKVEN